MSEHRNSSASRTIVRMPLIVLSTEMSDDFAWWVDRGSSTSYSATVACYCMWVRVCVCGSHVRTEYAVISLILYRARSDFHFSAHHIVESRLHITGIQTQDLSSVSFVGTVTDKLLFGSEKVGKKKKLRSYSLSLGNEDKAYWFSILLFYLPALLTQKCRGL